MTHSRVFNQKGLATLALALAGTLILAGCGSSDSGSDYSSSDSGSNTSKTSYGYGTGSGASSNGSGATSSESTGTSSGSGMSSTGAATVSAADVGKLGKVLVDGNGMTLYYFEKDSHGKSKCDGACAQAWPPLTTDGNPVAKNGAMAAKLGTTKRSDGSTQVTYAGWPLYLYAGDTQPGQANGNNIDQFGAEWYALTTKGEKP